MRIGDLARRTGLTVRTLHHYDELGLVKPGERTHAGHRIYSEADVERLYRVLALRSLGLRLDAIARVLEQPGELREVVARHRAAVERGLELHRRLHDRLSGLLAQPDADLLPTIEVMQMIESHYTPEQLETLAQRAEQLGPDGMEKAQQDWADLYAQARRHLDAGTDPADPSVQALVTRSEELIAQFTGGDAGIRANLERVYRDQGPQKASRGMADPEVHAFLLAARGHRDAQKDQS